MYLSYLWNISSLTIHPGVTRQDLDLAQEISIPGKCFHQTFLKWNLFESCFFGWNHYLFPLQNHFPNFQNHFRQNPKIWFPRFLSRFWLERYFSDQIEEIYFWCFSSWSKSSFWICVLRLFLLSEHHRNIQNCKILKCLPRLFSKINVRKASFLESFHSESSLPSYSKQYSSSSFLFHFEFWFLSFTV